MVVLFEQEGQGGPERAERDPHQPAGNGDPPDQRVGREQPGQRRQRRAVPGGADGRGGRQYAPEHAGHQQGERARAPVDGAPPGQFGERAGVRAGRQHADQQPALDRAHDPAPALVAGERDGQRRDQLRDRGEQTDQETRDDEPPGRGRHGGRGQGDGGGGPEAEDQPAPVVAVAGRDHQQDSRGVTELGGRGDGPERFGAHVQVRGGRPQQRLVEVDVGRGDRAGDGQQHGEGAGELARGLGQIGQVGRVRRVSHAGSPPVRTP